MQYQIFDSPTGIYQAFNFPASGGCPQRAFKAPYDTQVDNGDWVDHGNGDSAARLKSAQAAYDTVSIK